MVNYSCPRCGYTNNIKTKYLNHLRRKNICKNVLSDDNLIDEYIKYNVHEKIEYPNSPQKIPPKKNNIPKKSQNITKIYSCKYCEKELSSYKNLWRHLKTCKEKKAQENAKKSMDELVELLNKQLNEVRKELENKNKQIDELIKKAGIQNNGTITNNIQNNIKLLAYKDTDLSKITDFDIKKCLNHNNMCVPHLIKMIHLDPDKPENHNVYISNLKNGYIMLYDGIKWNTHNREEVIDSMIDEKQIMIEEKIEDWVQKGKQYPNLMRKFERYINKKEKNEVLNKIKEEVKLILYNNRVIVQKDSI